MIFELQWFKPNKYFPFIPLGWEGYTTYFVMLCLVIFSFFYFEVSRLLFSNILFFLISVLFITLLFFVLAKNTSEEKVSQTIPNRRFIKK